jgi:hypothetical protein
MAMRSLSEAIREWVDEVCRRYLHLLQLTSKRHNDRDR